MYNDNYFDSDEFREILGEYEKAVNTGQPVFMDADELSEIADFYQMNNRRDEAESAIRLALSLSPGAIAPLTYRLHEALFEGDTKRAWEILGQITEKSHPDYVYDRGEILICEGRVDEADQYFRDEIRKIPPEEYQDFAVDVASIYADYNLSEKAMEWMSRTKQEDTPEFKELMARTLFGIGKYKDSERLFNELIDTDPYQKRYWNALASAQMMNEDYSHAIESSEYAIAIDPKDAEGLIAKANGLYSLNNYEQAAEYYRRYLEQEPDDELARLHLGTCLINTGQNDKAIDELKQAIDVCMPDSPCLADIYQELAFAYSEKDDADEAMNYMAMTDTLECDHTQANVIKGHIMLAAGRVEEAEDFFRQAIISSDDATQTLLRVIVSLYDNQYLSATYTMLKKFFRIAGPENADGYAYMALCCYDMKNYDECLSYLKIACQRNPKECRMVMGHLFPSEVEPRNYYDFLKEKINSQL